MIFGFMDPFVLACPPDLNNEEAIVAYVERLIAWGELKNEGWICLVLPRTASDTLAVTNGFPPWERLRDALTHEEIGIQASDVFSVMNALLSKSPTIEDLAGIDEILLDDVTCVPDFRGDREPAHKVEYERFLGMISLLRMAENAPAEGRQLLTTGAPCPHSVEFSATLLEIAYSDLAMTIPALPAQLKDHLLGVCCTRVAKREADCLRLWETADKANDFRAVIGLYTYQQATAMQMSVPSWKIGGHFVSSIASMSLKNRASGQKVLRACSETILGQNLTATHGIRESRGGGSSQLRRGKDLAYRRDIDYEIHLHYWMTVDGPELASVAPHSDISIPA